MRILARFLPLRAWLLLLAGWLWAAACWANAGLFYASERLTSGLVTCLCQDSLGFVWVGTEYGLNKFDGYHFSSYLHHRGDSTSLPDNEISSLYVASDGTLWVGCARGLARYDRATDSFHCYRFPDDRRPRISSLLVDSRGRLLIGTAGYGLYTLKPGSEDIHFETAMNRRAVDQFYSRMFIDRQQALWRSSHIDTFSRFTGSTPQDFESPYGQPMAFLDHSANNMLIVCQRGILRYDYRTRQLSDAGFDFSVVRDLHISRAMLSSEGDLYIGTTMSGLLVVRRGEQRAEWVDNKSGHIDLRLSNVCDVMEDRNQNLWTACYNKGLLLLNKEKEAFDVWRFSAQNTPTGGSTAAIVSDGEGGIYCALHPGGIYRFDAQGRLTAHPAVPSGVRTIHRDAQGQYWLGTENALYSYDPLAGQATVVKTFEGRGVTCITDDGQGTLFVGVFARGLYVFSGHSGQWERYTMSDADRPGGYLCNNWIKSLFIDSRGLLWICTVDGVSMMKPAGRVFNSQRWNSLLEGRQCYSACETADGNILIGTDDGLYLYRWKENKVGLLPNVEPLQGKLISAMVLDRQGTIWLSTTTTGIWQMSADGKKIIGHVNGNGLQSKGYMVNAFLYQDNGQGERIFFGNADGITTFCPADVVADTMSLGRVHLTRLLVNGHSWPLHENGRYGMTFKENNVQMEFSLLNYHDAENISFQWRINGSKHWQAVSAGDNQLVFNELQPGTYHVEVRAANAGILSTETCRLTISIAQPWYRTTWAYLFYAAVLIGIIGLVLFTFIRQQRRNLEETKMRFLINATHDIRSPLTLIMGAVGKLRAGISPKEATALDTIDRNAQRLLTLVNQILDERRIDKGQMKLHCQRTEMVDFIGKIVRLYAYNAEQRNIVLHYEHPDEKLTAWVDHTQFDKVIANLLSNAFKFTPDGGSIGIKLSNADDGKTLKIEVSDTGLGFEDDRTERFFDRFYQGKNSRDLHIDGTGIGLNLSRAITEMHGGTVTAQNRKDGQTGAILTIVLPRGNEHLKPEEMEPEKPKVRETVAAESPGSKAWRGLHILIADDDPEIGRYISQELSNWYHFDFASNGREALKMLLSASSQHSYDLLISDVMMPEMDGLTLLRSVKQNTHISHIPVILLTSKSEVEFRLEGLRKGADGYLAKPFQMEELHVLIDNLVNNMRRLKGKFTGAQEQQDKVEQVEVKGNDDMLMERIMKSINAHLSDPDLNMEILTQEIGISRAQLHRKMKEITGISTSEFIRNLRLEQAARLIKEKKINITQVAYSVGFNNQAHFSTVFKKHFGMTPTEFASNESKNADFAPEK